MAVQTRHSHHRCRSQHALLHQVEKQAQQSEDETTCGASPRVHAQGLAIEQGDARAGATNEGSQRPAVGRLIGDAQAPQVHELPAAAGVSVAGLPAGGAGRRLHADTCEVPPATSACYQKVLGLILLSRTKLITPLVSRRHGSMRCRV